MSCYNDLFAPAIGFNILLVETAFCFPIAYKFRPESFFSFSNNLVWISIKCACFLSAVFTYSMDFLVAHSGRVVIEQADLESANVTCAPCKWDEANHITTHCSAPDRFERSSRLKSLSSGEGRAALGLNHIQQTAYNVVYRNLVNINKESGQMSSQ